MPKTDTKEAIRRVLAEAALMGRVSVGQDAPPPDPLADVDNASRADLARHEASTRQADAQDRAVDQQVKQFTALADINDAVLRLKGETPDAKQKE